MKLVAYAQAADEEDVQNASKAAFALLDQGVDESDEAYKALCREALRLLMVLKVRSMT